MGPGRPRGGRAPAPSAGANRPGGKDGQGRGEVRGSSARSAALRDLPQLPAAQPLCDRWRRHQAEGLVSVFRRTGERPLMVEPPVTVEHPVDDALLPLLRQGDARAFEALMRRNNRRLFRLARSIVGSDAEAEDVVQEGYVRAFAGLDGFRGDARLDTWLARIVSNEALGRLRRRRPTVTYDD